ncbi:hypothetical protein DDZ13_05310 [Coraliomargarita sinensis]|uniref:Uncharacterized protein n=1 Tax=Coraliomargarita sinensis TaxID=2174842 RepID=A0A317ZG37_9BACT|nr:hypothetical protein [Coraliomargarita sinensis]PXA04594.1 hypothetical protein DDZ13_05310 [Coraliomargarita sinensis]
MGWGRTLLLGDIGNRLDIEDTEREIGELKRSMRGAFRKDMSQDEKIEALIADNAELKLYLASLVRLLVKHGTIAPEELREIVEKVDAEDGRIDGKYGGEML